MTFEMNKHNCEICNKEKAKVAMNDKDNIFHYCCEQHTNELFSELEKL